MKSKKDKQKNIAQKVIVITGASSGIGAEIARIFKAQNHIVCNLSRDADESLANNFCCDVTSEQQVERAIGKIVEAHKNIDVVINCAGYGLAGAIELTPTNQIERQFDTNMLGCHFVDKHAIPHMKSGSKIVHIASACALFALPYRAFYCASKSALDMYSRCLKMELSNCKIDVVCINPGDVKTNFSKNRVKVFDTNERYGDRIQKSIQKVESNQEKRMSATYVAQKIVKISSKKRTKPMYIIGAKYKFLHFASKILPQSMMLKFTKKMFG